MGKAALGNEQMFYNNNVKKERWWRGKGMVRAQTVIKIVNGGCWGLSGRQAQKEWLVWGSDSVGRCASRAPGGGALLQD